MFSKISLHAMSVKGSKDYSLLRCDTKYFVRWYHKMEASSSSELLVPTYQTACCHKL